MSEATLDPVLQVIAYEGIALRGRQNVEEETLLANVRSAIRQGHPQIRPQPPNGDVVCIVGSGPSLADTDDELVALLREGAKLVTVNGAYHWALARHLHPRTQIVMDARPSNARFLAPEIPGCNYCLSSQCAPACFAAVAEYTSPVWIFHGNPDREAAPEAAVLNAYYGGRWAGVAGGTTVGSRAVGLMRMLGYLRMHLFGIDSCWLGDQHHAFPQVENDADVRIAVTVTPSDGSAPPRTFSCAPWHIRQFEDFLQVIRVNGHLFQLAVHGDGLLAHALRVSGGPDTLTITTTREE